jgi:synapsin
MSFCFHFLPLTLHLQAAMYGKLLRTQKRLGGFKEFPLVPQSCYSDWRSATFHPDFPAVAKIGTASGGLGKMKIDDSAHWDDFCSVAAMQTQFFFSEPFIKWDFDIRIQKIGNHYRAFRRTSQHWKSNVDMFMKDEDMEVIPERYIRWIEEASADCGMDICAIDLIRVEAEDKEYILELNSSAIGLNGRHHDEDNGTFGDVILKSTRELTLGIIQATFGIWFFADWSRRRTK